MNHLESLERMLERALDQRDALKERIEKLEADLAAAKEEIKTLKARNRRRHEIEWGRPKEGKP